MYYSLSPALKRPLKSTASLPMSHGSHFSKLTLHRNASRIFNNFMNQKKEPARETCEQELSSHQPLFALSLLPRSLCSNLNIELHQNQQKQKCHLQTITPASMLVLQPKYWAPSKLPKAKVPLALAICTQLLSIVINYHQNHQKQKCQLQTIIIGKHPSYDYYCHGVIIFT